MTRGFWRSVVSAAAYAPPVRPGAWPKRRLTWWTTSSHACRCGEWVLSLQNSTTGAGQSLNDMPSALEYHRFSMAKAVEIPILQ